MSEDGTRACDRLARQQLRPHTSRVFTGARRWLWQEFCDPPTRPIRRRAAAARRACRASLWHLGPKIMEVDAFVLAHRVHDIREVHPPNWCFSAVERANKPLPSKKSEEGDSLRRTLLQRGGFRDIDRWLTKTRIGTGAKRDDVLDACAVAIAARERCRQRWITDAGYARPADADLVLAAFVGRRAGDWFIGPIGFVRDIARWHHGERAGAPGRLGLWRLRDRRARQQGENGDRKQSYLVQG